MPKAVAISEVPGKPGEVYYPLALINLEKPAPGPDEVVIRVAAAALNHRDLWIRRNLYSGVTFGVPLLADASGKVVEAGENATALLHKRVVPNPGRGWLEDRDGPENEFAILGGTRDWKDGALSEFIKIPAADVEVVPDHLSDIEAAAFPLTGLTAWRALVTKSANAEPGRNILVTGIGGGVALMILLFGVSRGCNIFVSSGSVDKIEKAVQMGAKGGVVYKDDDWVSQLKAMLPKDRSFLDAVVDGAGGDAIRKLTKILKPGGIYVCYGMTLGPSVAFPMTSVLSNIELRGSTMGSRVEFKEMMETIRSKRIRPVVSRTIQGIDDLDAIEDLFRDMKEGKQFGKLVIEFSKSSTGHTKL